MSKKIEEVIARREDLSTFLVHLVSGPNPKETLKTIIESKRLVAKQAWGFLKENQEKYNQLPEEIKNKQKCVCYTETPLEYIWSMCEDIEGRDHNLSNFGIIITKKQARQVGVNPIWYIDATPGHTWLTNPINDLIKEAIEQKNYKIFELTPFFEMMGTWGLKKKEFWWEREWRCRGDFAMPNNFITLCPEEFHNEINESIKKSGKQPHCIDSKWSLEKMVAHLARFNADEIGPF